MPPASNSVWSAVTSPVISGDGRLAGRWSTPRSSPRSRPWRPIFGSTRCDGVAEPQLEQVRVLLAVVDVARRSAAARCRPAAAVPSISTRKVLVNDIASQLLGRRQQERGCRAAAQRVVDPVEPGERPPRRGVAVLGDRRPRRASRPRRRCASGGRRRCRTSGSASPGSLGISSRETLHRARIGSPSAVKSVYFALTEVTNAGKLVIAPQCRTTRGGLGFFWPALSSVGTVQLNSCSTASTTLPSCLPDGVEEHLQRQLAGLGPAELGRPGLLRALGGLALPLGGLLDRHLLGVELEGDACRARPPSPGGVASYSFRAAFSICGREVSPDGDGAETPPPPAELVRATALAHDGPASRR